MSASTVENIRQRSSRCSTFRDKLNNSDRLCWAKRDSCSEEERVEHGGRVPEKAELRGQS